MKSNPRIDLRNVTLCAVDCINPRLASRAIEISSRHCDFGDAILFTHEHISTSARIVYTPKIDSREEYNVFLLKHVIAHIRTQWLLVVQWDGYVVDPSAWQEDFLQYDYVGARWSWHGDGMSVGNGGFSLRSAKLMRLLANDAFPLRDDLQEDELICRYYRPMLETNYGIRFAPDEIADQFSHEHAQPSGPTFGFHSPHNMYRYLSEQELDDMLSIMDARTIASQAMVGLLAHYLHRCEFPQVRSLYGRISESWSQEGLFSLFTAFGMNAEVAAYCIHICETMRIRAGACSR